MTDVTLAGVAAAAGLVVEWKDASGISRTVKPDVLRQVLLALGIEVGNSAQLRDSRLRLRAEAGRAWPLCVAKPGRRVALGLKGHNARLIAEDGSIIEMVLKDGGAMIAPRRPGYYQVDDTGLRIAVTPDKAHVPTEPLWAIGVQIYGLRGGTSLGFGDFRALAEFCRQAGERGAGAIAISPVHALFAAAPDHISPYAPSTRLWLNAIYAEGSRRDDGRALGLVNWPRAAASKWKDLRAAYGRFRKQGRNEEFRRFVREGGVRLLSHARFEMLDARFRAQGLTRWQQWPRGFQHPNAKAVRALRASDPDVEYHLFLQWRAATALGNAQNAAREAGMPVGLIADMAVGVDPAGSHAWSAPEEVLNGLTVGAPPDLFNRTGQNWGLTTFQPRALMRTGFDGYIATIRAAMRYAGGIRLDHAMGLERLWVVPEGASPADGVYLRYPLREMLGLLALESQIHGSVVIAEDLGTVPPGFREKLAAAAILGMRVLWFERDRKGSFVPPSGWDKNAAALSTTHDLPTLAGWWCGKDLAWRRRLGGDDKLFARETEARQSDRKKLWRLLRSVGCAKGAMPTAAGLFVDAAFRALAMAPAPIKLLPIEDFIGETEQPNLPGTTDEHPNWRRRVKSAKPLASAAGKRRAAILRRKT